MLDEDPGPFAAADEVVASAFDSFLPPERIRLSVYAAQHRKLTKGFGEESRQFDPRVAPYLAGPSDALSEYLTVVVPGPGQCAKSTIAENWFQQSVESDPADFLWYMQTGPGMDAFVKDRIDPMIKVHPKMAARLGPKAVDGSLSFKNFGVMRAEFLNFTPTNLIAKNAPRIVADDVRGAVSRALAALAREVRALPAALGAGQRPIGGWHAGPSEASR
jgi:phage terminase large subunit GpA-like protein